MSSPPMPPTNAPMPPTDQAMGGTSIMCPSCGAEMALSAQPMQPMEAPPPPSTPQEEMGESPETQAMEENTGQEMPQGDQYDQMASKYGSKGGVTPDKKKSAALMRAFDQR